MSRTHDLHQRSARFPPRSGGVLLPRHDRAGAALGVAMYTASRPSVLIGQRAAWHLVRVAGTAWFPWPDRVLTIPGWAELDEAWREQLGHVVSVASYERRDPRAGSTLLARLANGCAVLLKVRSDGAGLIREQRLLEVLRQSPLPGVGAPRALGHGRTASGIAWSAQEVVFDRPHGPVLDLPERTVAALSDRVSGVLSDSPTTAGEDAAWPGAHRDLTPWNLRRDRAGRVWLLDFEDAGRAPAGADLAYLALSSAALRRHRRLQNVWMTQECRDYWLTDLRRRVRSGHHQGVNFRMIHLLEQ